MAIIGTLPITLTNGSTADATQVMSDLNFIVNQVNANGNPAGTLTAPTGTSMNFFNAAAPLGWTINAAVNDHTVWLNAAAGGTAGGASAYSTMFQNAWTSDGHALSVAELAIHTHADGGHVHTYNDGGHNHAPSGGGSFWKQGTTALQSPGTGGPTSDAVGSTNPANINISINTGFAALQNAGSGNAHSHTKTFNAQYIGAVVAVKS